MNDSDLWFELNGDLQYWEMRVGDFHNEPHATAIVTYLTQLGKRIGRPFYIPAKQSDGIEQSTRGEE